MTEAQKPILTDPYIDLVTNSLAVDAMSPVFDSGNGEMIGITGINFTLDNVYEMMKTYKLGKTDFYVLVSSNGTVIYHPNEEYKNAVIADTDMSDNIKKAFQNKEIGEIVYTNGGEQCHGYLSAIGDTGWMVATGLPEKEFSSIGRSVQTTTIVLFLIALLIVLALIVVISKQIVAPIKKLASVAVKMALGDIDVDVKGISASRDEIGELTEAFDKMVESIRSQSQVSEKIAAGDLSVEVRPRSDKDVLRISMVSVVDTLKKLVEEAEDMTAAALGGRLDNRGDSGQFEGGYREIIEGFNETLDALTGPLKIPAEYMQRISRGDIPPAIADEYKGDFGGERNRGSAGKRCGVCTGVCPRGSTLIEAVTNINKHFI